MNLQLKSQNLVVPIFILALMFSLTVSNSKAAAINKPLTDTIHERIFMQVETQPMFPGGFQALGKFLSDNIHYPAVDKANKTEGRVICTFVIEKDGTISNIRAVRTPTQAMGEEAVRVLSLSPVWKPGYQGGKTVRVAYTIPISFKL
jgi:protein TonB